MTSSITMKRWGWARDSLTIGEHVTVGIRQAISGRHYGLLDSVEKANGISLVTSSIRAARPVSNARASSVLGRWIADRFRLPNDYPCGLDQLMIREFALTEAGRIAEAVYSQVSDKNPELLCISKPTPALIIYTDLYMELVLNEDERTITTRNYYFDQVRTVYMDDRKHPPASELFHEGHSVGWWEEDILAIDTTNFAYHRSPYQNGIPSGSQKHVAERYKLIDDGARMKVEFVLEDPEYIVGSMNYSRELLYSTDNDMSPFNCDLESTRRFLSD